MESHLWMLLTGTEPMGLRVNELVDNVEANRSLNSNYCRFNDTTLMYLTIMALPETLLALQAT